MVAEGVEYGVGDFLREQVMHHLVFAVVEHLGHDRIVTLNAAGNAVDEV